MNWTMILSGGVPGGLFTYGTYLHLKEDKHWFMIPVYLLCAGLSVWAYLGFS